MNLVPKPKPLTWLPRWSQKSGVLPDGNPDPQQYNDCGETCCSMVIAAVTGVAVEPGALRQELGGWQRSGLTTGDDLVRTLTANAVSAINLFRTASVALTVVKNHWGMSLPTILLGQWQPPDAMHWVISVDYSTSTLAVINPWDGLIHELSKSDFTSQFAGSVVAIGSHVQHDMSMVPTPGT